MALKLSRSVMAGAALFTTAAFAAVVTVADVNVKVANLLAPANDANTQIEAMFTKLSVDSVRATGFGFELRAEEIGTRTVKFDGNIDYDYQTLATGDEPRFSGSLALETDFIGAFGQDFVNQMGSSVEQVVMDFVNSFTAEYGAAAQARVTVENMQRDAQGNVVAARVRFDGVVDLAQLPASTALSDVQIKEISAVIEVNFQGQQSARLEVSGVFNPAFRSFQKDETGLKELIELLLNDDPSVYQSIGQFVGYFAAGIEWVANTKP